MRIFPSALAGALISKMMFALMTLASMTFAPMALAQTDIDTFATAQGPVTQSDTIASVSSFASGAGILGTHRSMRVTLAANNVGSFATLEVTGGELSFTTNDDADFFIWWDGQADTTFNGAGLGGIDLTNGSTKDRFVLDVSSNTNTGDEVRLAVWTDGGNRSDLLFTMPASGTVELLYSSFSVAAGTGADFTNVGAVSLGNVLRPGAWSFALSFLETTPVELLSFGIE